MWNIKELLNTKSKSYNIQLIKEAKNELINLYNECINKQDLIIKSINRLEQIALNKNGFESQEDYIELLIADEKCEQRPGYKARSEQLENLLQQKKMIKEIYKGENKKMNSIKQFIENSLNKENI